MLLPRVVKCSSKLCISSSSLLFSAISPCAVAATPSSPRVPSLRERAQYCRSLRTRAYLDVFFHVLNFLSQIVEVISLQLLADQPFYSPDRLCRETKKHTSAPSDRTRGAPCSGCGSKHCLRFAVGLRSISRAAQLKGTMRHTYDFAVEFWAI